MKRSMLLVALLFLPYFFPQPAVSADNRCSPVADMLIGRAITWKDVYRFYQEFAACDQGYLAEGVSDRVVKILAEHWKEMPKLGELALKDEGFFTFVIMHIDRRADWNRLCKVAANAKDRCPGNLFFRCEEIAKKALDALPTMADLRKMKQTRWKGCSAAAPGGSSLLPQKEPSKKGGSR